MTKRTRRPLTLIVRAICLVLLAEPCFEGCLLWAVSPQQTTAETASALPRLVRFGGTVKDLNGNPLTGVVGITFALYSEQTGGAALWLETQNITADSRGHFVALLGSTKPDGLPTDLFTTEQAHWVGVQVSGQAEQPRVLLASAPYALKARDAETIGGLPPSAFILAGPVSSNLPGSGGNENTGSAPAASVVSGSGTTNFVPLWFSPSILTNSVLFQLGSGNTATLGINTTTPAATLDVNGGVIARGALQLPSTGTATSARGFNSQPFSAQGSAFNSGTGKAIGPLFQWQTEPSGNNTSNPTGTLNLLYSSGSGSPSETGLNISSSGQITFAAGQTFPGTGSGTVTSVAMTAPTSDFILEGSPITTSGTLSLIWTVPPDNNATANAIVKRDNGAGFSAGNISAEALSVVQGVTAHTLSAVSATITGGSFPTPLSASSSNPASPTIYGAATTSTGAGWGVEGETFSSASNAYGVVGLATSSTGSPIGTYGQVINTNAIGEGVFGQYGLESITGSGFNATGVGVWGDGGKKLANSCISACPTTGVLGTTDDGYAGLFINTSPVGYDGVFIQSMNSASRPLVAMGAKGSCFVDANGNLTCSGTKNAVVPVDGGARQVAMSAIESPQNWFEDAGEAELVNGAAVVQLDPTYIQTVNTGEKYQVFLTPYGDCKGLYVTKRAAGSFEVHELGGGTVSLSFGYRIMAIRRNYETVRFADRTQDMEKLERERSRFKSAGVHPVSHDPGPKARSAVAMGPATQ
jgi:hypothetical protein